MHADAGHCDSDFIRRFHSCCSFYLCLSWCVSLAFLIPLGGDLQCVCLLSDLINLINVRNLTVLRVGVLG